MVLTLHDVMFHRLGDGAAGLRDRWSYADLRSRLAHWIARSRASRILADSEHSRAGIVGHLGLPADKVVTYLAADAASTGPCRRPGRRGSRQAPQAARALSLQHRGLGGAEEPPRPDPPFSPRLNFSLVLAGGADDQRARPDRPRGLASASRIGSTSSAGSRMPTCRRSTPRPSRSSTRAVTRGSASSFARPWPPAARPWPPARGEYPKSSGTAARAIRPRRPGRACRTAPPRRR